MPADDHNPTDLPGGEPSSSAGTPPRPTSGGVSAGAVSVTRGPDLVTTLRILSEEIRPRRQARALRDLSLKLQSGAAWPDAVSRNDNLPADIRVLLETGVASQETVTLLQRALEIRQQATLLRRQLWLAMAYPMILLVMGGVFLLGYLIWVVPVLVQQVPSFHFSTLEISSPMRRASLMSQLVRMHWAGLLLGVGIVIVVATGLLQISKFRRWARRMVCAIPWGGTMLRSISLSHFCQVLALLVRLEIPLSRALHAAGQTAGDSDLAFGADKLATAAEHGTPLAERARPLFQFPEGLLQTFRWERDQELLVTGLEAYGELYAQQAETYSGMIRSVGQPVIIILLAGVLMYYMTIVPFFMPVIKLLNDLS